MATCISTWMRTRPVFAFYILTFTITWLGWIPQAAYSHGLFPFDSPLFYVMGGIGPLLAAFIVMRVMRGGAGDEELLRPLLRWRVGVIWYIVALFGYVAIWLAVMGLSGARGPEFEELKPSLALLPVFLVRLVAAIPEEVAWRGFALPQLQARYSALVSSLIIGVLWALWHLPLLLNTDNAMSTYPLIPYFLHTVALAVLYTWLYNSTQGSLLIVTVFHAAGNTVGYFVALHAPGNTIGPFIAAEAAVTILLAAIVVIVFGPAQLSRRGGRIVQNGKRTATEGPEDGPEAPSSPATTNRKVRSQQCQIRFL